MVDRFAAGERLTAAKLNATLDAIQYAYSIVEFAQDNAAALGGATLETDARKVIQAAWQWSADNGSPVFLPGGEYVISTAINAADWDGTSTAADLYTLLIVDGMHHISAPDAYVVSAADGTYGFGGIVSGRYPTTARDDATKRSQNFVIDGGVWGKLGAVDGSGYYIGGNRGNIFAFYGQNCIVRNVEIRKWQNGRAFQIIGDNITLENVRARNPAAGTGAGGIRLHGGYGFICRGADVISGDDTFQLVPPGNAANAWAGVDTENCWYLDCVGQSVVSRLCIAAFGAVGQGPASANIKNSGFINIQQAGGNGVLVAIRNEDSTGLIDNILCQNITGSSAYSVSRSDDYAVNVYGGPNNLGGIGKVMLENITVTGCNNYNIRAEGDIAELVIRDFKGATAFDPIQAAALLYGIGRLDIDGLDLPSGGVIGALVGAADLVLPTGTYAGQTLKRTVGTVRARRITVRDIADDVFGISATNTTDCEIVESAFRKATGATTARGINAQATVSKIRVDRTDFSECGHATPFVRSATTNITGPDNLGLVSTISTELRAYYDGGDAISAHMSDGAATGGNARGSKAVDWQTSRTAATEVASGATSFVGGGKRNTASGISSAILGGEVNEASAVSAAIGGGTRNLASGSYSWVTGGQEATTRGTYGRGAWSAGQFGSVKGNAQAGEFVLRAQTTDATQTNLTSDGAAASSSNIIGMTATMSYMVRILVVARQTGGSAGAAGDTAGWTSEALFERTSGAATTNVIGGGGASLAPTYSGAAAAAWRIAVVADTTNGGLVIKATGEADKNINWVARVMSVETVG